MKSLFAIGLIAGTCGLFAAEPAATPAAAPAAPEKKLVMHLAFDEGEGAKCADSAGGAIAEIVNDMRGVRWVDGKSGKALEFKGTRSGHKSGAVRLRTFYHHADFATGMSVEMWLKLADDADWQRGVMFLLCCSPGNYGPGFIVYYNWRNFMFLSGAGAAPKGEAPKHWNATATVPDLRGQWVHLAVTYDAASQTAKVYLNGKLDEKGIKTGVPFVPPNSSNPEATIGSGWHGAGCGFNGIIDEVKLYNYPLSAEEIINHAKLDI